MRKISIWILVTAMIIQTVSPLSFAEINVDIPVPEFRSAVLDIGEMQTLDAYANGVELVLKTQYDDISSNPFEKHIIKMAALGVAERNGDTSFRPGDTITGFEVIEYLVRLSGQGGVVEQAVAPQTGGLSDVSIEALYNQTYANQALGQGILLQTEYLNLGQSASREQIALWVARTIGLQPQFDNIEEVFGFNDYQAVRPENRGLIEALLRNEVMTSGNDGNFNPQGNMTRGEFMEVLDSASVSLYDQNNIATNYGLVTGVQENVVQEVGYSLSERTLIVRNVDGSATAIKTNVNNVSNQKMDLVIYKDGMPFNGRGLIVGDEIQYFTQNDVVVYAEAVDDNTILEKIKLSEEQDGNMTTYFGSIYEVLSQKHWIDDRYIDSSRYRVRTFDGQTFDLVVETDLYSGVTNDMIVYKDRMIGGASLLEQGDDISFVVKNNDSVVYVSAIPLWNTSVSGTVRYVTTDDETGMKTITVFGYDDVIYEYPVASYANVAINDTYATIDDLRYGQDVTIDLKQGYVINVDSETFTEEPGYIPQYGKARVGEVFAVYPAGIVFDIGGKRLTYTIPEGTPIVKGGVAITKNALTEGDKVKLFFDDIYSDRVSKIEVEGIQRLIKQVYKGRLGSVNERKHTISLYQPRYLKNNDWEATDDYTLEFDLVENAEIYVGDLPVPIDDLEKIHRDQTVYIVVEDLYGDPVATKLTIKYGGENLYSETIHSINDALGSMELGNRINMNITKGTIVLKDGRIIDSSLLAKNDNVMVVSEYQFGENNANVIKMVTSTENIFERIYIGAIEQVGGNYFNLRHWSDMDENEWNRVDDTISDRFYYHTSSKIMDISDPDDVETIKAVNFFQESYARIENKSKDDDGLEYERYYAVVVLEDDENDSRSIVGMTMNHKEIIEGENIDDEVDKLDDITDEMEDVLDDMFLTRGVVDSIDTTWERIKITDSNDWISSVSEWKTNSIDTYTEYTNALIVKENDVIEIGDINPGDTIHVLRNKEKAMVIFVSAD